MNDAAILVPSRGRAGQLGEMIDAALGLSVADTILAVAVDDDDPDRAAYAALEKDLRHEKRVTWRHGPRNTMAGWTNALAGEFAPGAFALGSFGDDHFPRSPGWDLLLLDALEQAGIILAWGDDRHQGERLPTAPLIRSAVVHALGWMCLPGVASKYCDNAWLDLCIGSGGIYRPDVIIEHVHPDAGKALHDITYAQGNAHWAADKAVYDAWLAGRWQDDVTIARMAAFA